jgi:phage internal scaffolding protein
MNKLSVNHLLGIKYLNRNDIQLIFNTADNFKKIINQPIKKVPSLRDITIANLFFENSTRTKLSFEIAEKRLSADVINFSSGASSVKKGETLLDTVNNILAMYMKTGVVPPTNPNAEYGDLSDFDYQSLQNQIANAHSLFEQLPENVRYRFGNKPYRFLNFVQDEKNYDELVEMGLANNPPTASTEDEALPVTDAAPEEQVMSDDTVAT